MSFSAELLTKPLFSDVLKNRTLSLAIAGASMAQIGLTALGLPAWQCPFRTLLNFPCPGCGLTRAVIALISGDFSAALTMHAFAPVLFAAIALTVAASLLPQALRQQLLVRVEYLETRTNATPILLAGLIGYWLIRLTLFSAEYVSLVVA